MIIPLLDSFADLQSSVCSFLCSSALCRGLNSQLCLTYSGSPGLCPSRAGGGDLWVHLVYSRYLRDYFPLLTDVHGVTNCFTYFPLYLGCFSWKVSSFSIILLGQVHKSLPTDHLIRVEVPRK